MTDIELIREALKDAENSYLTGTSATSALPGRLEAMAQDQPFTHPDYGDMEVVPVDAKAFDALIAEARKIAGEG